MITKKIIMFVVMMAAAVIFAAPTVTDVTAKQRYPWNGLVDITCKVTGIEGTANGIYYFSVAAVWGGTYALKGSPFWVMQNGVKKTDRGVSTNGNYRLLWDAQADLGRDLGLVNHGLVIYSNMVVRVTLRSHGKVQLWEGGPYWADTNIGADEPWEYGCYFWWGDIVGYNWDENDHRVLVASDGSSSDFSFEEGNAPTYNKSISALQSEGWITADGVLAPAHDAAHVHWGDAWRMPTYQELSCLTNNCDWTWATKNGVNGYEVRGRGDYASNSIFLPCAGVERGPEPQPNILARKYGFYWSSVPSSDDQGDAWDLGFSLDHHRTGHRARYAGQPVRPVQGFTE